MHDDQRNAAEVFRACTESMQNMWAAAWLFATLRIVPDLFPRVGASGQNPWRCEIFMVAGRRMEK